MKKSLYIALLSLLGLGSCASQKKMQTNPPFTIETPSFQKWTAGKEEGGSGLDVKIPIDQLQKGNIIFKDLYFRGKVSSVVTETIANKQYVTAKFTHQKFTKPDIIMHADPRKEVGNQPPMPQKDEKKAYPFELAEDEAVISYLENNSNKLKYTKITGFKEMPVLIYSSKPMN
tara:strand:+ start:190552 stop:191070 length:519 start_codon:yes stop_codon:yes gene_type:complete